MRTCVWCDKPLPEPQHKGHRRREFCSDTCKQQHYLWHKKMKHDADMLAEPYWKATYKVLVEDYKWLEGKLQERLSDFEKEQNYNDILKQQLQHYKQRDEDIQADCIARLRALGMSEQDIKEFDAYWKEHTNPFPFNSS
jgi:phage regulator Rha-like protein